MPVDTVPQGDELLHIHDLSDPAVKVDVTKDRALLREPEVSEYIGYDILRRGVFRPERGRKPIGASLPIADQPIVSAIGLSDLSSVVQNKRYLSVTTGLGIRADAGETGDYVSATGVIDSVPSGNYDFTEGDVCAIYSPISHRGVYPVLSRDTGVGTITIKSGIAPDASVTFDIIYNTPIAERLLRGTDNVVKTPALYAKEGPWTAEQAVEVTVSNSDERAAGESIGFSPTISTRYQTDDSIDATDGDFYKIQIISEPESSLRGILMTNGRKFWLLQGGSFKLLMDLGSDDLLGETWRSARIARNRLLLVNSKYAPRVLHLNAEELSVGETSGDETLAGCIIPAKPIDIEPPDPDLNDAPSWLGKNDVIPNGGLTVSTRYKVKVRGVNLEDGLESQFVQVHEASGTDPSLPTGSSGNRENITIQPTDNNAITIYTSVRGSNGVFPPPIHSRITHIEVWRSTASGDLTTDAPDIYYLESRMEIATLVANEKFDDNEFPLFDPTPRGVSYPVQIADSIIPNFPIMTSEDLLAGGLPPICRDVVSLQGVTFCFGKADASIVKPILEAGDYLRLNTVDHTTSSPKSRISGGNLFANYTFVSGDKFRILHGGRNATTGETVPIGDFDISSKINNNVIELTTSISSVLTGGGTLIGQIIRPFTIEWPRILSDEEVWYSRTDLFAPESFPVRVKTLSRSGDIFRRAVKVSNYVAVIMDRGVHLTRIEGTEVIVDEVSSSAEGTPWPDSVVVVGTAVLWATQQGVKVLIASPDKDIEGRRAKISPIGEDRFRSWFEDAFNSGENIDAGVDETNGCVRFRRAIITSTGTHYQVLQYNFRNDAFVFLDDDSGFIYAGAVNAESLTDNSIKLYSVSATGNAFEVNYEEPSHPYDDFTLSGTLDSKYIISPTSLTHRSKSVFTPKMAGDVIRFNSGVEYVRTILSATARKITFAAINTLGIGDTFSIAAVRTRVRFAPLRGKFLGSVKTIDKVHIKARKGSKHVAGSLMIKSFNDLRDTPAQVKALEIFDPDDTGKTTENEVSSIEGQGASVELQVETSDPRVDYEIKQLGVHVREESDVRVDSRE